MVLIKLSVLFFVVLVTVVEQLNRDASASAEVISPANTDTWLSQNTTPSGSET